MRMTVREFKQMGRDGFTDAMLAELEEQARRPDLSPAEREAAEARFRRAKEQISAPRGRRARPASIA